MNISEFKAVQTQPNKQPAEQNVNTEALFSLRGVSKRFGSGDLAVEALRGIDLDIPAGEIFGIIGLSGAGKSTLIRCLNLLERPSEGQIFFRGTELQSLSRRALLQERRKIGMIFQHFHLLRQRTTLGNVLFPLEIAGIKRAEALDKARTVLELVGLSDKAEAYPCQLSGGQQQRAAIARALAAEPEVLLCDEATSALDPATTLAILELLKRINRELGVSIVLITHEMAVVKAVCSRAAVLDHGCLAETGEVEKLFQRPGSHVTRELIFPKGA